MIFPWLAAILTLPSLAAETPEWTFEPDIRRAELDSPVLADVNGDGYDDVIAQWMDHRTGQIGVFFGGPGGPSATPDQLLFAPAGQAWYWPTDISSAGDVDGDGDDELLVSEPDPAGAALYLGSPAGLPASPDWGVSTSGSFTFVDEVGDLDGDGFAEVAVSTGANGLQLYAGAPAGPSSVPQWTLPGISPVLAPHVTPLGDGDGDGDDEFLVAQGSPVSMVDLYEGSPGGPVLVWSTTDQEGGLGYAGALVDLGCDGDRDLVLGHLGLSQGPISARSDGGWLVFTDAGAGFPSTADSTVLIDRDANLGGSMVSVGDLDGDQLPDLLLGGPFFHERGAVAALGSVGGALELSRWAAGTGRLGSFGDALAVGDVDGDALVDVLVSEPYWSGIELGEGRMSLYLGVGGPVACPPQP